MTIQPLTPKALRAAAREAAEQHIPLDEATHHEQGTPLWTIFANAYMYRRAQLLHAEQRQKDREFNTTLRRVLLRRSDIRSTV